MNQLTIFPVPQLIGKVFSPKTGMRRSRRPLSSRHPIHLILHSKGMSLKSRERLIGEWWRRFGRKFGIKTYRLVICGNHIHAIVRLHNLRAYSSFVRAFTGTIARKFKVHWSNRPSTRIANWGRDFKRLCQYLNLNFLEAGGFLEYQPQRTRRLPHFVHL